MSINENKVYKILELVGSSELSIEDATNTAIAKAAETIKSLEWFTIKDIRGSISENTVKSFQVILKVGFRIDDSNSQEQSNNGSSQASQSDNSTLPLRPKDSGTPAASTQNSG